MFENCEGPPYVRPVKGWKIVGHSKAPWPGNTDGFAVVFEKETPAEPARSSCRGEDYEEGTRIWQHYQRSWLEE